MINRRISWDVKLAAIRLYECNLLSLSDILECCGFFKRTWYRILNLWQQTGDVINPNHSIHECIRTLDSKDIEYLVRLV